ncbi:MAG: nif11-like peptide radical SAM maturase [Candidatus Xenobiia bacterium LiM19]
MEQRVIKPCHVFDHQGRQYVINIEQMSACIIDDEMAGVIKKLASDHTAVPDSHTEEQLKKLELLSEGRGQSPKDGIEKEPIPLVSMCLFLTQSCNLKCVYCYGEGGEYGTGGSMDEKTAFQAVDWMLEQSGKIKKLHIGFFGGEPFLKFPLMKALVEYARKRASEAGKDVAFHGTTNATLLDDEIIAFLKEHDIPFMVSFDGTKELQDRQRPYADGRGSYDSTVPRIKKLLEAMPRTHGHAIIVGATDPQPVKDALMEIGFSGVSIMPASKSLLAAAQDKANPARDTRYLIQEMEEEAEKWITLTRKRDSEALKILKARGALYNGIISLLHNSRRHHACGAGLTDVAVSCSGDVYLCHRFVGREEFKLGTIFEKDLKREEYLKSPVEGNELCSACFARYYCAGGCKHDNVGACGSISKPSEDICRLRCRQLELAAAITCRLDSEDRAFLVDREIFPPKPCPFDF